MPALDDWRLAGLGPERPHPHRPPSRPQRTNLGGASRSCPLGEVAGSVLQRQGCWDPRPPILAGNNCFSSGLASSARERLHD